ncbi:CsbD family protein [Mycobacterium simiae]|uniref:CsbD family protein n=1 Tax=Mycobacterium simiae TaxID=1784 RepID=A0A1X0Y4Q7_MYCSI|nr:CsbD family protein [Mycobacterium simiae]ORJ60098.1 CsbD family protein [Mycobacterium simiae]
MADQGKSGQARKGLLDSLKGKVKEVVGAVSGNDSLTAEGQLDQTQAQERREANAIDAVAEQQAQRARTQEAETKVEGARQRLAANAQASAVEGSIEAQQTAQKRAADQAAAQSAAVQQTQAKVDAERQVEQAKAEERAEKHAAAADATDAAAEHHSEVQVAANEKLAAERLRREAESDS